ncbi:rhodanese-like domain-containing protein [Acidaminobacter sp. JC074]|uniref:rhodanese-like domain-containing protein n=1 Tax=Acidaminobacter sp. JC074 TaxID=2530199 RepID=UPI001F0F4553|nr:rhodanese-like domain-containing protein [Acidaminobacter sp. JC074]MCH4888443.1 rhodanese-like domain-containing protein [Acidaminobacter sp. JC074]
MKLNKRILSFLLVFVLVFSFVACSDNSENNAGFVVENEENNSAATETETATETATETETETEAEAGALEAAVNNYFANLPDHIYKISQVEFVEMVKNGEDMFVIDMRSADDYAKGHIEGAVNILFNTNMSDSLADIPQDKPVFIYCYSGQTAGQAVATLNVAGINARSVNLGWNFGISKVDGVADITTTEPTELVALGNDIDPEIQAAVDKYYADLATAKGTDFGANIVSEDNFKKMMDEGASYYLLSIRQQDAYDKAHIPGAELLPYGKGMQEGFDMIPKDEKVVVYCYSGQTAGQTVAALRLLGYDAVSLKGGMGVGANAPLGWTNKGFVVESPTTRAAMDYFKNMPDHIYKIGQADFVEKVANGDDMFIIDMRSADDYAKGHIQGAVNINFNSMMSDNLLNIPQDKEVFIYCYSGQTAGQAVATLNMAGINARSVNLGWNFGISKVDGIADVTSTEAVEIEALGLDIDPTIQEAMDAYYAGLAEVKGTTYQNYMVSEANLKEMVDNKDDSIYILSIRQEDVYDEGHIEGATLLPFSNEMAESFNMLPTDKTVVVYCYSGQTAGQTVAALRLLGYDAVSLKGGMGVGSNAPLGWSNQGYPVVTE